MEIRYNARYENRRKASTHKKYTYLGGAINREENKSDISEDYLIPWKEENIQESEVIRKIVNPTLIFGYESWTTSERQGSKIIGMEMKCFRKIKRG